MNYQLSTKDKLIELRDDVRRAFREFLAVPTLIIAAFLLLAWGSYGLDAGRVAWLAQLRKTLQVHVFSDAKSTSDLLSTIASGLIAMTSSTCLARR